MKSRAAEFGPRAGEHGDRVPPGAAASRGSRNRWPGGSRHGPPRPRPRPGTLVSGRVAVLSPARSPQSRRLPEQCSAGAKGEGKSGRAMDAVLHFIHTIADWGLEERDLSLLVTLIVLLSEFLTRLSKDSRLMIGLSRIHLGLKFNLPLHTALLRVKTKIHHFILRSSANCFFFHLSKESAICRRNKSQIHSLQINDFRFYFENNTRFEIQR